MVSACVFCDGNAWARSCDRRRRAGADGNFAGVLFGLGAAVFYASVVLMNKTVKDVGGLNRTLIQFEGAVVLLLVIPLIRGGFQIQNASLVSIANLLTVGILHTGLCYWLYFFFH